MEPKGQRDTRWEVGSCRSARYDDYFTRVKPETNEAPVSVTAVRSETADAIDLPSRRATFPEGPLKIVPTKRHNSRLPIQQPSKTVQMIADEQPLIKFDLSQEVDSLAGETVARQADSKQMRRRSTRRLSRRISLAPAIEAAVGEPSLTSPLKHNLGYSSPLKRRSPIKATPRKVAMSPAKKFTISVTPIKAIPEEVGSTTATPAARSSFSPDRAMVTPGEQVDHPTPVISPAAPLIFDQPTPDVAAEPAYET